MLPSFVWRRGVPAWRLSAPQPGKGTDHNRQCRQPQQTAAEVDVVVEPAEQQPGDVAAACSLLPRAAGWCEGRKDPLWGITHSVWPPHA